MSDFTIKVFREAGDPVPPTQVGVVGKQLEILAESREELISSGATIHRFSESDAFDPADTDWGGENPVPFKAATTLLAALSYRLWDDEGNSTDVGFNSSTEDVNEHVKLVFVFEEYGQMVVPVPTAKNIQRGLDHSPLRLPSAYDRLISDKSIDLLVIAVESAAADPADENVLNELSPAQLKAIESALRVAANNFREGLKGDPGTFFAQLGDYSVRQCHS